MYIDVQLLSGSKDGSWISHHVNELGFGKSGVEGRNVKFIQGSFVYPVRYGYGGSVTVPRPMHRHDDSQVGLKRRMPVEERTGVIGQV